MKKVITQLSYGKCPRCGDATVRIMAEYKQHANGRLSDGVKKSDECPICHWRMYEKLGNTESKQNAEVDALMDAAHDSLGEMPSDSEIDAALNL